MKKTKHLTARTAVEIICISTAVIIAAFLLHRHTPRILVYLEKDDIDGLTSYIRGEGQIGEIVLIVLQVVETISIFLPALPVYICAGIIYGRLEGILMCYVTNLVINACMFLMARKMHISVTKIPKYGQNPKVRELMQHMQNPKRAILIISLLPIIPNGMIPYIAASTDVTFWGFLEALSLGCLPGIILNVVCGDALLTINWRMFLPVIIVIAAAAALIYLFRKPIAARIVHKVKKNT